MNMPERIEEYKMIRRAIELIHNMGPTDKRFDSKETMEVLIGLSNIEFDKTQDADFAKELVNHNPPYSLPYHNKT